MSAFDRVPWKRLESGSPTAFLVAGVVLLGYAALKSAELLTGMVTPDVLKVTIGHLGLLVPVFGLLGLYPLLRDSAPRLSLAGLVTGVVSGACSIVLLVKLAYLTFTMEGYPAVPEDTPLWGSIVLIGSLVAIMLGFLLIGAASLRTEAVSRTVGYLLFVPAAMWSALFLMTAAGVDGTVIGSVVYVPIATSLLAVGHRLPSDPVSTDSAEPLTDPTV